MPSKNKTTNLGLNQWQGNEYVKRQDFVNDNELIDEAFGKISEEIKNIDLSSTKVIRPNKKTVEESLVANETSISSLETKVNNGQNFKLTSDNGKCINKGSKDANELILNGHYDGSNMLNMPNNSSDWWYIDVNAHSNGNYVYQEATELNKDPAKKYYRTMQSGTWKPWRSL